MTTTNDLIHLASANTKIFEISILEKAGLKPTPGKDRQ